MRRPLAVFGFTVLFTLLTATRLPAGYLPYTGFGLCLLAGLALWRFCKTHRGGILLLTLLAAGLALLFRCGYDAVVVAPIQRLAGQKRPVTLLVEDVRPGFAEELSWARVQLLTVEDEGVNRPFKLQLNGLPPCQIGDVLSLDIRFYSTDNKDSGAVNRAKGQYIGASAESVARKVGEQATFLGILRRAQYVAGDAILEKLPLRLSSVLAAMAVGDKRAISPETQNAYRMAGLSHMLVVSGMHLSVLCGGLYWLCSRMVRNKRVAAALAMLAVFFFMAFTGLTPSILRSGVVFLLVLAAQLCGRRPDIYTSLGFAALLLLLQNPYAAADAGLQLSFMATLGVVQGGRLAQKQAQKAIQEPLHLRRWARRLLALFIAPIYVTLATLPVMALNGFGLSLLSVPMNILAVPLLAPLVVCGFVMALPGGFFITGLLARPASFLAGIMLVWLEKTTSLCAGQPWLYLPMGGLFALVAILLAYLLVWLAFCTPYKKTYLVATGLVLPLALGLHLLLNAGTVRLSMAGSGDTASLVVSQGGQAVVLYRGRPSLWAVQQVFRQQSIKTCVLWVDMRKTAQSTEAETEFLPSQLYITEKDLLYQELFTPLEDVTLSLQRQENGTLACVDVAGYKVGVAVGGLDLMVGPQLDVLVPAGAAVCGEYEQLVVSGGVPTWASPNAIIIENGQSAYFVLRSGRSVVFREANHDILF